MSFWLALVLLAVSVLAYFSGSDQELIRGIRIDGELLWGIDTHEIAVIAGAAGVALLVLSGLLRAVSGRGGTLARRFVSIVLIGAVGFGAYNYRDELGQIAFRIAGEFGQAPLTQTAEPAPSDGRSFQITRRRDGHFTANVSVNGKSVPMLVDTGASTVVLRQSDAKQLGVDLGALRFTVPVQTANGVAYAAHVRLRTVMVGPIALSGVDALVAQQGVLKESLLGMSFLSRLKSYEFSGQKLTFRQ